MNTTTPDVVVVGGGPAGAAAAITMAATGRRVMIIERRRGEGGAPATLVGEGLPAAARLVLQHLGVWPAFRAACHSPSPGTESIWGTAGNRTALADPYGAGWQLDRARFDRMLLDRAADAGADVRTGDVVDVAPAHHGVNMRWRERTSTLEVNTPLAIDATGRRRRIARRLGGRVEHGDRLVGVAAHLPAADGQGPARVEAVADGWWYTTAVPAGGRVVVFFTDPDLPAARRARKPGGLATLAAGTLGVAQLAPSLADVAGRAVAAGTSWLVRPCGRGWVAVGDAAFSVDPLSAQGLMMAMVGGVQVGRSIGRNDDTYESWLAGRRIRLCLHQRALYLGELRWPNRPFWVRRGSPMSVPARSAANCGRSDTATLSNPARRARNAPFDQEVPSHSYPEA